MSVRERLSQAAFELFAERGFDETTVDDITARAGTGRTTFFRAFGSKEEVVFPDHDSLLASVQARLDAAAPGGEAVALAEAARLVLLHYLAEGDLARTRYVLTRRVPALRAREIAGQRQYQRVFLAFARQWYGEGSRADLHAELLADAVVTAHNHVLRQWLRGRTDTPESDFDEAMAEVLRIFGSGSDSTAGIVVLRTGRDLDDVLPGLRRLLD
ncbi:MAG TPA: TetR family transcriptional regulator [Nocardioides sp.]|uniref:TetR family transcriptional regulator n=1 Tax=Nocardioides sp. TaxID=35761 RepID=UPI002CC5A3D7|nr:TetR family transcriptional regulator [Nocardioides sp.]HTW15523.1 TetR family transcriptional regulator [Nocardioides sp.]